MAGVVETAAPRGDAKRLAVLDAATEEFLANGYSETSMDRIAEVARVSKRTVYDHFPSKDDLFQAIITEILPSPIDGPAVSYSSERSLEDQLIEIGDAFARSITCQNFVRLARVVASGFVRTAQWHQAIFESDARSRRDMVALFEAGTSAGRLRVESPEEAAAQLCGLIREVAFWPEFMAGQQKISSRQRAAAVKAAVRMLLDHYRPRPGESAPRLAVTQSLQSPAFSDCSVAQRRPAGV